MELADVPLLRRYGAAVNVVDCTPGLTVAQRAELLWIAVFPPAVSVPGELRKRSRVTADRDRLLAVELRGRGVSEAEVAERFDVARTTVRDWVRRARAV